MSKPRSQPPQWLLDYARGARTCRTCGKQQPLSGFYRNRRVCKVCVRAVIAAREQARPDVRAAQLAYHKKRLATNPVFREANRQRAAAWRRQRTTNS